MDIRRNGDVLRETLDLDGKDVLDVGCGDGALVRMMTKRGARVTGVEISPAQIARARAADAVGDEVYIEAPGERLPFGDGCMDIVVFFNSLHHVDVPAMDAAIAEAARVLRPGGLAYVAEPMAEGSHFQVMQPAHDETAVRAAAQGALDRCAGAGLARERAFTHINVTAYADYGAFRKRILQVNPHRTGDWDQLEPELRARFDRLGVPGDHGIHFDQPMRVTMLRKPA